MSPFVGLPELDPVENPSVVEIPPQFSLSALPYSVTLSTP